MGVSNYHRYKITRHAKERYAQRIDGNKNKNGVERDFRTLLSNARYLGKEHNEKESWLCEKTNVVLILDPKTYTVITVYNSVEQYKETEGKEVESRPNRSRKLHPKVEAIISNASKQAYIQQEKKYFAKLAPLYKEYGDRIDKLSRTTNAEHFENKRVELNDLQKEISRIVKDKNKVLSDLKGFIKNDVEESEERHFVMKGS